jgi:hypothetical protein
MTIRDVKESEQGKPRLSKHEIAHTRDEVSLKSAPTSGRFAIQRPLEISPENWDLFWNAIERDK